MVLSELTCAHFSPGNSRRDGKNTQKNCIKKDLNDLDINSGGVTHLEPDILECLCRGTRDQIANNRSSIKKVRDFQRDIYLCCIDYSKAIDCVK